MRHRLRELLGDNDADAKTEADEVDRYGRPVSWPLERDEPLVERSHPVELDLSDLEDGFA